MKTNNAYCKDSCVKQYIDLLTNSITKVAASSEPSWQQLHAKPPIVVFIQSARKLMVVCWTCLVYSIESWRALCNMSVSVVEVGARELGCRR